MEHPPPFETYDAVVGKVTPLTPRVHHIRFDLPQGQEIHFRAGQYVQVLIPLPDKIKRASYSIASAPQDHDHVDLCVTLVQGGVSSPYLHHLKEGNKLQVVGPLGKFTLPDALPRDIVFVAAGSGVAPFHSMILDLIAQKVPRQIYLVLGHRFEEDILYHKEWEELAKRAPNFKAVFALSQGGDAWKGQRGYVQDAITSLVPDLSGKDFYLCGLVKMIDAVSQKLTALGVPKEQVHYERYD